LRAVVVMAATRRVTVSDLFYKRIFRDDLCPIVGGRRLIPRSYLTEILDVLRARGVLPDRPGEEP
jgi:hypothetical protein